MATKQPLSLGQTLRMKSILFFFFSLLMAPGYGQLLIQNTTLVDVENKKLLSGQDVLIENGLISLIGKKLKASSQAATVDGSGKFLIPGLIDAHVHFFQSGGLYTRPDAIDLRKYKTHEKEIEWSHQNMESLLRRYLSIGITSVIDVGATLNFFNAT